MSSTPISPEIVSPQSPLAKQSAVALSFDPKLAQPFIYKSVSEETRSAYHRAIREFFQFAGNIYPSHVSPMLVIAYRDHLRINKRRKPNTVATKLAIVRSFFEYLRAGGIITVNPASTKLVTPPELPTNPQGRVVLRKLFSSAGCHEPLFLRRLSGTMKRRTLPVLVHRFRLIF